MKRKKKMVVSGQLLIAVFFLILSCSMSEAAVTLSAEDGFGLPGSTDRPVQISLDNRSHMVEGLQVDICDDDDYLELTDCDTNTRTTGFTCVVNEMASGCARIIMYSADPSNTVIAKGTGSIVSLKYSVSEAAPSQECRDLELEGAKVSDDLSTPLEVLTQPGEFCFTEAPPTTTTTTPVTTTIPVTTTTTAVPTYRVTISPREATIDSETTLQFTARTTYGDGEVTGSYLWEIVPASAIGSAISATGLFTAGENATAADIEETVKITDTAHENKSATATVTVKIKEEPLPECTVKVNPSSATVISGESLALSASTVGDAGCEPGEYEWSISTQIESVVDQGGIYTAGNNTTANQLTDTVTVIDHANSDINGSATITVESEIPAKSLNVFPEVLLGFRWIPLPYLLIITSEDALFTLGSTISFEPAGTITPLLQIGFGNLMLSLVVLNANPAEGTVSVAVTTGEEIARGEVSVVLLPFL